MTSSTFQLRPYQVDGIRNTLSALKEVDTVLLVAPTGSGKTVLMGEICRRCVTKQPEPYNVLILAHREELLNQAQDKLFRQYGIIGGIIKGGSKTDYQLKVQIASVQTYVNRLDKIPFKPKVVIVDEAHHCAAETYMKILNYYKGVKVIGLTATPYRASGEGLKHIFQRMVQTTTIKHLEDIGFLVPARCFNYPLDNKKLDAVDIVKGDMMKSK